MVIENARWSRGPSLPNGDSGPIIGFLATIDGMNTVVPKDPDNEHYAEAMRRMDAGALTIADAD